MFLSLDTSTLTLALALAERTVDGELRIVEQVAYRPPRKQSQLLPGAIGELLRRHHLAVRDLEGIAVGLGPGSFTGLRIGLATAKAIAYAMRIKLAGVSSLAAVALEGTPEALLIPTAIARRGELYIGKYRRHGMGIEKCGPEEAVTPTQLAEILAKTEGAVALGPAMEEYGEQIRSLGAPAQKVSIGPTFPSAASIASLAQFPPAFQANDVFGLEPHYVRASAAEENPAFRAISERVG